MKKHLLLTFLICFTLSYCVEAHAPKKIKASYNSETNILELDIPHKVKNVETHYMEKVIITINGEETVVTYSKQSSKESHHATIELSKLEKGTVINIYAKCNKLGSKKLELIVE